MKSNRAIIVQARMSSKRLPGKSLMKIGGYPLIYYVLNRLKITGEQVIVATSTDFSDDVLVEYLKEQDFKFYRGSLDNVLNRYIATANKFGIDEIIRVTGDNPFVDIELLQGSLALFERYTYVDGIYEGGLIKGTGFELVKLKELKNIFPLISDHKEHVTQKLREEIENSTKRIRLKNSFQIDRVSDIILTCDFREDFDLISSVLSHFNYRFNVSIDEIINYLINKQSLKNLNAHLH
jgi:spore coat polysaccharide biosynthesis protein SpsF